MDNVGLDLSGIGVAGPPHPSKWSIIPLHTSDRGTFKQCRRRWDWSSPARRNLTRKVQIHGVDWNLLFGTGIHYALQRYYDPRLREDPVITFTAWIDLQWNGGLVTETELKEHGFEDRKPQFDGDLTEPRIYRVVGLSDLLPDPDPLVYQHHKDLGIGMMEFYKKFAEREDNFSTISVEHTFSVPILDLDGNPLYAVDHRIMPDGWEPDFSLENIYGPLMRYATSPVGLEVTIPVEKQVHARGKMDKIVQDQENGQYGIHDYKSTARLPDDDYFRHLPLDEQVTCVPMDSEALTPNGWRKRSELNIGDVILAYDSKDEQMRWTPILAITDGESSVSELSNNRGDFKFRCTDNHRWIGRRFISNGKYAHWTNWETTSDRLPTSHGKIRVVAEYDNKIEGIITDDEAALLGWILSDGSFGNYNGTFAVQLSQANFINDIDILVEKTEFKCTKTLKSSTYWGKKDCFNWRFSAPEMRELFDRAGITSKDDEGSLNQFILRLQSTALEAFCQAAIKAEGSKNGTGIYFSQQHGALKNAFRLAFFLNGQFTTYGTYEGFSIKKDQEYDSRTLARDFTEEKQPVWCPTTKYGTWIMRQNDIPVITGNTYAWAAEREAEMYGLEYKRIDYIIYEALFKAYPKPPTVLKSGLPSLARGTESTTAQMFEEFIEKNGLRSWFDTDVKAQAYYEWLLSEGDIRFINRYPERRNRSQLKSCGYRLYLEALDMLSDNVRIYPNPTKTYPCLNCTFRTPCVMAEQGGDYEYLLNENYTENYNR